MYMYNIYIEYNTRQEVCIYTYVYIRMLRVAQINFLLEERLKEGGLL